MSAGAPSRPPLAPDLATVGRRVRRARNARGLSQRRLAKRCGMTQQWLVSAEQGRSDFRLSSLAKLARALNVGVEWLVAEDPGEVPEVEHPWRS